MKSKVFLIAFALLSVLVLSGCNKGYVPDLSDPWLSFCYHLELDEFTYECLWENKSQTYNITSLSNPIAVKCEFSHIQYEGQKYCGIQSTKLGYSIYDEDYLWTESKHDGIDLPCRMEGESLNETLKLCYDLIPKELKGVKINIKRIKGG